MQKDDGMATIVVGVDGSAASRKALAWAAKEAELHGATLHVVHAWEVPSVAWGILSTEWSPRRLINQAKLELGKTIGEVVGEPAPIEVRATVEEGNPVKVLLDAVLDDDADLLVVSSRGRGGFKTLLLGSVSEQCVTHAKCPVAVIRSRKK
ncbi:MAG: universal stress protein [Actinomycetes bacterium]